MTFWADAEQEIGTEYNHYHLMNILSMPLGTIFEARISLEAIGLLRTCRKNEMDSRVFAYDLLPPLDARAFFADPLLSTFLFSKIGEKSYRSLRNRFIVDSSDETGFDDVSRTFLDVYTPIQQLQGVSNGTEESYVGKSESSGVPFVGSDFDFELLISGLSEQMVPKSSLSAVSKETIEKLAFLYSLNPLDMQKVIMMALDEDLKLPEDRLRKATAEYYKMNVSKEAPVLHKVFVQQTPRKQSEKMTRDDTLEEYLESTPPAQMLRDINGKEPMSVDVQLAERLINTHGLPIGVVNVLLQYILLRNDGKITNKFAERIASHWMGKKIMTVKQALDISRKEHDQYMQWKAEGQNPTAKRTSGREEKVPEWFYKKDDKEPKKTPKSSTKLDEERRKLLEELGVTGDGVN
jgi:replication initiation and membrane attachment protein